MMENKVKDHKQGSNQGLESELLAINTKLKYYQDKAFIMLLELVAIIGIPAALAVAAKTYIFADSGKGVTVLLIGLALAISWTIIIYRGIGLSRSMSTLTKRRREIQDILGIERPKQILFTDELELEKEERN